MDKLSLSSKFSLGPNVNRAESLSCWPHCCLQHIFVNNCAPIPCIQGINFSWWGWVKMPRWVSPYCRSCTQVRPRPRFPPWGWSPPSPGLSPTLAHAHPGHWLYPPPLPNPPVWPGGRRQDCDGARQAAAPGLSPVFLYLRICVFAPGWSPAGWPPGSSPSRWLAGALLAGAPAICLMMRQQYVWCRCTA